MDAHLEALIHSNPPHARKLRATTSRGESTVSLDELESHDEVTFVAEEGDEDDDGSGWGERPGVP